MLIDIIFWFFRIIGLAESFKGYLQAHNTIKAKEKEADAPVTDEQWKKDAQDGLL